MKINLLIPGATAIFLLCSLPAGAQTVVRETTTTAQPTETTTTTAVQPIEAAGTIAEFAPDGMVIRTQEAAAPIRYSVSKSVVYVDEAGNPVAREIVKTGVPVTVRYVREGDQMIVNRVIVHRATTVAPEAVTTQKTTTTTTTTEGRHDHDRDKDKDRHHDKD